MLKAVRRSDAGPSSDGVETLVLQIAKLLRHPAFRREAVVSPLLMRHLPKDGGYAWRGEAALRERLRAAGLDAASLDHLVSNARSELARLRGPGEA